MGQNNAKLPDVKTLLAAGINPRTGLPLKMGDLVPTSPLCEDMKRLITNVDRQDAANRYV